MKTKIVEVNGVKGIAIDPEGMNPGEAIAKVLAKAFGIDIDDDDDTESDAHMKEKLFERITRIKDLAKEIGKPIDEVIAIANADDKDNLDCYCPRCVANVISSITDDEIAFIGADAVEAVLHHVYKDLDKKTGRDLKLIYDKVLRARELAKNPTAKKESKSYEDMSREELIAELNKKQSK